MIYILLTGLTSYRYVLKLAESAWWAKRRLTAYYAVNRVAPQAIDSIICCQSLVSRFTFFFKICESPQSVNPLTWDL